MAHCEVPYNRDGPRAPTAIHGLLGLKYHPVDIANATAKCLENQFTPHDLCEENHERRVEARVQALLEAVDSNPPERIRPVEFMAFQMNASSTFQEDHWFTLPI
jgi:hypothetical protein